MSKSAMNSRERVQAAIAHQEADRIPVHDGIWGATVNRWWREGLPPGTSPNDFFDYDIVMLGGDQSPRFPIRTLSRNDEYVIHTTAEGGVRRNHHDITTTPEIIDVAIKTKDDWPAIRERLTYDFKRIDWVTVQRVYQEAREKGRYIVFGGINGFDAVQQYMRSEVSLVAMATDPDWIKEMVDTISDLVLEIAQAMWNEGIHFDGAWLFNDMGYRNGTFFSPQMYRDLIGPSDKKRNDWFHEHGMQTLLHSCGNVKEFIPLLVEHGFDCLQPLEVKAGMDVRQLKADYGSQIALFGGIDVQLMLDPDDTKIEREIAEKFAVAKPGGGYLYHSDHSVPHQVSFQRYQFIMDCVRKYGAYD